MSWTIYTTLKYCTLLQRYDVGNAMDERWFWFKWFIFNFSPSFISMDLSLVSVRYLPSAFCPFSLPLFTFYIWWCFFFSFPVESRIYGNWIAWWVKRTVTVYYEAMKSINMKYEPNKKKFFDRKQHAKLSAFSSLDIFITSKSDFFAVSSILYHG